MIRKGPSLETSTAGSRSWSTWTRASCSWAARLSAPEGQPCTARTISSIRPPLGATKVSASRRNTVGSRSVQNPEWAQVPRLSRTVTCTPTYVSSRSGTRLGSLRSVKPMSAWVPSQRGLDADRPQRQSAIWGIVVMSTPSQLRIRWRLVTR